MYCFPYYLYISARLFRAEFVAAIVIEILTIVIISFSLLLDQRISCHHQQSDVITKALEWAEQHDVFTTNPSYSIRGKALEKVVVVAKNENEIRLLSRVTKVVEKC